ncbi:hypothetical protein PICMEDRAFT_25955, partial [Pichia membranifaciens NRRL Y-2026]
LPNPCLLGIVFTIATHDGNQLVFHYPPKPNEYGFQATPLDMNELSHNVEGLNDSSEDEIYDDDDDDDDVSDQNRHKRSSSSSNNRYQSGRDLLELMYEREQKKKKKKILRRKQRMRKRKRERSKAYLDSQSAISSLKTSIIEKLFSFDADFISDLATPPKSLCNTRFELTVEDMVFLGLPIHIQDDGSWRISKKSKFVRSKSMSTSQLLEYTGENSHVMEKDCGMYQFHMLFVMNPPVVEYNHRIDEMFHYIISRISLLLRYEQQKTNYVWEESKKILKLKEELVHLPVNQQWKTIIEKSSLAKLICETYKAVSRSQIVNIEINGKLNSFQIPIRREFVVLPPNYVELPEYSTLSSISPFNQLNSYESPTSLSQANDVMAFFGLILLDDTERIIRDIKAEKDSVIASFIRLIKPSESLQRLSVLSGLDIQEVKMFANHLVYWRRAMAVLPLTSRSIYVVSPIAPIKNIYKDSPDFNRTFPNLPPLPTFLSMISDISTNKPKSISNIIPSRDHRDLYMDAIAWLFKRGYIIQLYTFLYLKITKEIKIKVAEEIEIEIKRKQELKKKSALIDKDLSVTNENGSDSDNMVTGNRVKTDASDIDDLDLTDGVDQSDGNVSSNEDSSYDQIQFEEEEEEDTILLEPEYSSSLERRWIAKVVEGQPNEISNLFYKVLKYMNGRNAQEVFMTQENISRHDMKKLSDAVAEYIVVMRHW